MGVYNPHAPKNLGQEWVPIRDEDLELSGVTADIEVGHSFTTTATRILDSAAFFINDWPEASASSASSQLWEVSIYPKGYEELSGPIGEVIIPCNAATVTGSLAGTASATIVNELSSPQDGSVFTWTAVPNTLNLFFAVDDYPVLNGKRILGVDFLTMMYATKSDVDANGSPLVSFYLGTSTTAPVTQLGLIAQRKAPDETIFIYDTSITNGNNPAIVSAIPMGSATRFWVPTTSFGLTTTEVQFMPWTWPTMQRVQAGSGSNRVCIQIQVASGAQINMGYAALRVFYCAEQRSATTIWRIGGTSDPAPGPPAAFRAYVMGINHLPQFRAPTYPHAQFPTLGVGQYTAMLSSPNLRQTPVLGPSPKLNAVRQLYEIPPHPGYKVLHPTPLADRVGDTFTKESTMVLPQISVYTSGGPLNEIHVYGRQAAGQVYGSITVTQEIQDSLSAGNVPWPWVRFYARRFGNTATNLTLTGTTTAGLLLPGTASAVASTPDNAALDITGDIDIRADLTAPSTTWFTTASMALVAKYNATGNQRAYRFYLENGLLRLGWSNDGSTVIAVSPDTAHVPAASGRLAVRVTLDVDDGGGNRVIRFYTAPTMSGTFTQLGSTITAAGTTSIFNSTANMFVGADGTGTGSLLVGLVHSAKVLNGIAGAEVANPDFSAQAAGTTSFNDAAGRAWTVTAPAAIVGGNTTSSVTLTPAEWDVEPEIVDGWKEITKRFSTVPSMGSGSTPQWEWSASGENAGNRWEVLGAYAAAISGSAGTLIRPAPSTLQLYSATYGQPSFGSTINMGWIPQFSPFVTATADDQRADATILFGLDAPTVTGFSVVTTSMAVSGIGQNCGINPCCIPTAILYNQVSWSATSSSYPISGFGYYELQRMDTIETDWATIARSVAPTGASFKDFEARIGVQSSYRIRAVDFYEFPGQWSSTVSITMPAPGVSGGCVSDGHILVFTSNERQTGSINLAYSSVWMDQRVEENFEFPESGFVSLQAMYNRDFFTAFRPSERGGERFSRTVLVQAAAISPETLGDFRGLRDMAWDSVSYICVRDEDGNRWFATVIVPSGRVLRDRRLYLAPVEIIEVTDTPSEVTVI